MASGLASLAGYGSDSDDEDAAPTSSHTVSAPTRPPSSSKLGALLPQPKAGLASKLPPPSSSASGSDLSLPPPTSSAPSKRKVIKVDSLSNFRASNDGSDSDEAASTDSKKPRLGSSTQNGSTSKHSLLGMLPAPKRKDDEVLAERNRQAEARKAAKAAKANKDADASTSTQAPLSLDESALRAASPDGQLQGDDAEEAVSNATSSSKPKGKNNDAFRAMLGLKPATAKPRASPAASVSSSASASTKPVTWPQPSSSKILPQPSTATSLVTPNSGRAASSKAEAATAPVDFFSLASTRSSTTFTASAPSSSSFSISSAPTISHPGVASANDEAHGREDEADEYPGWQLDPDGSWAPVTPEAHAQLLAYQQSLSQPTAPTSRSASNLDGTRDLLAAGLTPEDIQAFDASTAARDGYLDANGDPADNEKYAAAAGLAAGNRDVQQRKPGMLKGLRKGQLSSLVSLASENRSQLEKRWQRNREAKAQRSNRYGF